MKAFFFIGLDQSHLTNLINRIVDYKCNQYHACLVTFSVHAHKELSQWPSGLNCWLQCMPTNRLAVMLVLGLKPNFCGLGLAIGWPWPWDCGLGLRGLVLAKYSRPKCWRTTMFPMNFHRLKWIIFQDPCTLLTYRANTGDYSSTDISSDNSSTDLQPAGHPQ